MTYKLLQGDVLDKLSEIETGTVQTCVTSPPYWGLRDYGVPGQLGLEPTPEEYVNKMVEVFREVKRVLRDDGTLWLNLGDSYNGSGGAGGDYSKGGIKEGQPKYPGRKVATLKPKDLVGIPWRVAFALRDDGWYLRSDIIWAKPNPMPESVTDRPTKAHEYIFLLTKRERYFYDADAVREPLSEQRAKQAGKLVDPGNKKWGGGGGQFDGHKWRMNPLGRNKRTVWTVATQPYSEAHFATFPPKLIEPCILAGSSPRACEICGAPWERVVERSNLNKQNVGGKLADIKKTGFRNDGNIRMGDIATKTTGWRPTCSCKNEGTGRCIVLDPFVGSGTTLWVAERFGRDSIGIEINPEYCELINKRMSNRQMTLFERGADL